MIPFRCSQCNKLLGMIKGEAEIKCPKCKTVNCGMSLREYLEENLTNNPQGVRIPLSENGIIRIK